MASRHLRPTIAEPTPSERRSSLTVIPAKKRKQHDLGILAAKADARHLALGGRAGPFLLVATPWEREGGSPEVGFQRCRGGISGKH
jgi:hypothetical protein